MYRCKKGVTLIETSIYLGLLAVVVGMMCINLNYFQNRKKEVAINEEILIIKDFIIRKQLEAINIKNTTKVSIDLDKEIISDGFDGKDNIKLKALDIVDTRLSKEYIIKSNGEFDSDLYIKLKDYKGSEYVFKYRSDQKRIEVQK